MALEPSGHGSLPRRGGWRSVARLWFWLARSLRHRGVRRTLQGARSTFSHYWFDLRYGTATRSSADLADLAIRGENVAHGVGYQPSSPALFHRVMHSLPLPSGSVFVDFGCGKGRVLMMAARYGFSRVVGVDFSAELCRVCRRNIEVFRTRVKVSAEIEVVESDAVAYRFRDDENVFYLFNPFDAVVMRQILARIGESRRRAPRPIWLIYYYPLCGEIIERAGEYDRAGAVSYGDGEVAVYRWRP
jgi:SAM-dependent methyltransferase